MKINRGAPAHRPLVITLHTPDEEAAVMECIRIATEEKANLLRGVTSPGHFRILEELYATYRSKQL